jgi:hypothetical protein
MRRHVLRSTRCSERGGIIDCRSKLEVLGVVRLLRIPFPIVVDGLLMVLWSKDAGIAKERCIFLDSICRWQHWRDHASEAASMLSIHEAHGLRKSLIMFQLGVVCWTGTHGRRIVEDIFTVS